MSNSLDVGKYQHFRGIEDQWSRTGIHTARTVPICRGNQEPITLTNSHVTIPLVANLQANDGHFGPTKNSLGGIIFK